MLAGVATWLVHRETLHYGFDYDDYHFLRPYTPAEVLATFHGPWDLTGIEVKFYRPLTIVLYAVRFELFGLNATGASRRLADPLRHRRQPRRDGSRID